MFTRDEWLSFASPLVPSDYVPTNKQVMISFRSWLFDRGRVIRITRHSAFAWYIKDSRERRMIILGITFLTVFLFASGYYPVAKVRHDGSSTLDHYKRRVLCVHGELLQRIFILKFD